MYKIEGLVNGQWDSTNVDGGNSDYNKWDTEEEAEAQIPELIKNFGDEGATADQFRVVEIKEEGHKMTLVTRSPGLGVNVGGLPYIVGGGYEGKTQSLHSLVNQ